jgi:D-arabinose 1-dehydrogenase-like Zn-dependent alcohol dehydrogenase
MGFRTVAVARGTDKEPLARKLGAHHYIDSTKQNVASELMKLGGARVILATLTDAKSMSDAVGGLGIDGKLMVIGAAMQPIEVAPLALISTRRSITGWPSGTASDSEDTMDFSVLAGIRPLIETFPLERATEAYERMMSGKARFRVVLTTGAGERAG